MKTVILLPFQSMTALHLVLRPQARPSCVTNFSGQEQTLQSSAEVSANFARYLLQMTGACSVVVAAALSVIF